MITVVPGGIAAKSLDLLHQIAPKARRIGILVNPTNAMTKILLKQEIPDAARKLGVELLVVEARTPDEIEPAINVAVGKRAEPLYIPGDPVISFP